MMGHPEAQPGGEAGNRWILHSRETDAQKGNKNTVQRRALHLLCKLPSVGGLRDWRSKPMIENSL
jgi:hypothetical protein